MKSREQRRREAQERNQERANRSPKQQLELLDFRLGKNEGAKKERDRLNLKVVLPQNSPETTTENEEPKKRENPRLAKKRSKKSEA